MASLPCKDCGTLLVTIIPGKPVCPICSKNEINKEEVLEKLEKYFDETSTEEIHEAIEKAGYSYYKENLDLKYKRLLPDPLPDGVFFGVDLLLENGLGDYTPGSKLSNEFCQRLTNGEHLEYNRKEGFKELI